MAIYRIVTIPLLLTLSAACVETSADMDVSDTSTSTGDIIETGTETGSNIDDLPTDDSDTETGASGLDMPNDSDTGDVDVWVVVNLADQVIGQLVEPSADDILDHDNVFVDGSPEVLHLTSGGFGFVLNKYDTSFVSMKHDDVLYTEPDCTGIPVDRFATVKQTDNSLSQADCDAQTAMAMGDGIILHYGYQDVVAPWVVENWPSAVGMSARYDAFEDRWFGLPIEQNWPEWRTTQSVLHSDGSCTNETRHECTVSFVETDWTPPAVVGPLRLVLMP